MPECETQHTDFSDIDVHRKKSRFTTGKVWSSPTPCSRTLELEGVIQVLKEYDSVEGNDINCCICGKSIYYKTVLLFDVFVGY